MKNQGVLILRVIAFLLCVFVVSYMGYHILNLFDQPIRTVDAVMKTTQLTQPVSGIVVRNERKLPLPGGVVQFLPDEGQRVSAGQTLAVSHNSSDALQKNRELRVLEERRELLAAAAAGYSAGGA